jgi:hypothetical protein
VPVWGWQDAGALGASRASAACGAVALAIFTPCIQSMQIISSVPLMITVT